MNIYNSSCDIYTISHLQEYKEVKIIFIFKQEVWRKDSAQLAELGLVKAYQVGSLCVSLQTQLQPWQEWPKAGKSPLWPEKPSERQWRYKGSVCEMLLTFGLDAASVELAATERYPHKLCSLRWLKKKTRNRLCDLKKNLESCCFIGFKVVLFLCNTSHDVFYRNIFEIMSQMCNLAKNILLSKKLGLMVNKNLQ